MVKKTKYNSIYDKNSDYESNNKSYIRLYLKEEIDFLLASTVNQLIQVEFEDVYIHNKEAEEILEEYLKPTYADRILFFTGLTGAGKTMILRHVFDVHNMSAKVIGKTFVIPFTFDNMHNRRESVVEFFSKILGSACEELERIYSVTKAMDSKDEFYECIRKWRGDNSQFGKKWPIPSVDERIGAYAEDDPLSFYSSMLKYYIGQEECNIDNVIFLIDDIEGIGENKEKEPIKIAYELLNCMQNQYEIRNWCCNLIISCRHYVYRVINNRNAENPNPKYYNLNQTLESYAESENYHLNKSPKLIDIIEKRYTAIQSKNKDDKWVIAIQVVKYLLQDIDSDIGKFILDLNLNNIRKSLTTLKKIIYNKRWIQRDYREETPGAFAIDDIKKYDTTLATLIRALGMDESQVYKSDESIITNLLYNELDYDMDFFVLATLKYFMEFASYTEMSWEDSIDIDVFYNRVVKIFDSSQYVEKFKKSILYLIKQRMLLRSIDQEQQDCTSINENNIKEIKKVYVSAAAVDLWEYLGKNSVLFEMYVDDIWMDNSSRDKKKKKFRGFDVENFNVCIIYLEKLIDIENKIRSKAFNHIGLDKYVEYFGQDKISSHLLCGLKNSIGAFYRNDYQENYFTALQYKNRLSKLEKKIEKI